MSAGRDLAQRFYVEAVAPLLDVPHVAGLLGVGSEVLGLDDGTSTDHDFGPRLTVLVDDDAPDLWSRLEAELPATFAGWPVRYPTTRDPGARHRVVVSTIDAFARRRLGVDPALPAAADWLRLTGQAVLEVTAGPVFHDGTAGWGPLVERLAWYPDDVWHHVLACGWHQVAQELPFVGRTAERGDDLGSRIIAGRLARRLHHQAFLVDRRWPPYPKWAGTVLATLPHGPAVRAALNGALAADDWRDREAGLVAAADVLAGRPATVPFFDRGYRIVDPALARGHLEQVTDPEVRALPLGVGSVEQCTDAVDALLR